MIVEQPMDGLKFIRWELQTISSLLKENESPENRLRYARSVYRFDNGTSNTVELTDDFFKNFPEGTMVPALELESDG